MPANEKIKNSIAGTNFNFYGIRIDTIKYNVGDIANKSSSTLTRSRV